MCDQFFLFFILTDKFTLNFQIYIIPGHVLFVVISRKHVCIILISSPFSPGMSSPIHMRGASMHTSFFYLVDFDHWWPLQAMRNITLSEQTQHYASWKEWGSPTRKQWLQNRGQMITWTGMCTSKSRIPYISANVSIFCVTNNVVTTELELQSRKANVQSSSKLTLVQQSRIKEEMDLPTPPFFFFNESFNFSFLIVIVMKAIKSQGYRSEESYNWREIKCCSLYQL